MVTACRILLLLMPLYFFRVEPVSAHCPDSPLLSDSSFQEDVRPAIDSLYNRQPAIATAILEPWVERCPDHPIWALWEGLELWWRVLEDLENEHLDDQLVDRLKRADMSGAVWAEILPDSPDGWFVRALSNGLLARLHANRGRWVRSILVARDAREASEELERRLPGLADHQLARGLTLYYSAWLPDRYAVLRPFRWAMPQGDRERGLDLLSSASKSGLFVQAEATYFLGLILLMYEEQPEAALDSFRRLARTYPENRFYQQIVINALLRVAQSVEKQSATDQARMYYQEVVDRVGDHRDQEESRQAWRLATQALERLGEDPE